MLRNTVALKHHRLRIKLVLCEAELGKHLAGSLHVSGRARSQGRDEL